MPVETRAIPPYRVVAYMRHVGPYGEGGGIGPLWLTFERWIRVRDLRRPGTLTICIGHDAPVVSAPDKLRYDPCLVVDATFEADRFVKVADFPGGKFAVAPFEGAPAEINAARDWLWRVWLPGSSYQPADRPSLELRHDFETVTVGGQLRCELCLPVGPL
jgi:AraC family transcriptional regulator